MLVNYVHAQLKKVIAMVDTNRDDTISKREFIHIMENVEAVQALSEVGVDVVGLVDFADHIFPDDNSGEYGAELSFAKFMEVVLQLRGKNVATVKDIVDLRKFVQTNVNQRLVQMKDDLSARI